jgi:hypothetical protein
LTTGSGNVDIASGGVAGESGAIRIGTDGAQNRTFVAGVSGTSVPGGVPVLVNASGKLGTATSASNPKAAVVGGDLTRELKRQAAQNRRQTKAIATLKREVARLSRR